MSKEVNPKRLNYFKRIIKVQEVYAEHKREGLTDVYIFRKHVKPTFCISYRTYTKYLATNAKREIRLIEEYKENQLDLFNDEKEKL